MDAAVTRLGRPDGLHFDLGWTGPAAGTAADATRGRLAAYLDGTLVWGGVEGTQVVGTEWTWVELLEHLCHSWPRIAWEQTDPFGLGIRADWLRSRVEQSRENAEPTDAEEWDLWQYEQAHNLAAALQGAWPRAIWLQREGLEMVAIGGGTEIRRPYADAISVLSELGDTIASRLQGLADPRAHAALTAWAKRTDTDPATYVVVATGLTARTVDALLQGSTAERVFEFARPGEDSELLAAARMAGRASSVKAHQEILAAARSIPAQLTEHLDLLGEEARATLRAGIPPHAQGQQLALWLRQRLNLRRGERVHPAAHLKEWLVGTEFVTIDSADVDAVCVWGPKHGPAVLTNSVGKHIQGEGGQMATLAHEICHLLIDRRAALPLAEVLGGAVPARLEKRARAFAAEFLLPRDLAVEEFRVSRKPKEELDRICKKYGVSRELLAWQLHNSTANLPTETRKFLKSIVSAPSRFSSAE